MITGPLAGWAPNRGFHVERNLVLMLPSIRRGFMNLKRLILNRFPCCIGRFLILQLRADAMRPRMTEQGIISSKRLCTGGTWEMLFRGMASDMPSQVTLFRKKTGNTRDKCAHASYGDWGCVVELDTIWYRLIGAEAEDCKMCRRAVSLGRCPIMSSCGGNVGESKTGAGSRLHKQLVSWSHPGRRQSHKVRLFCYSQDWLRLNQD
jgi:hypothetical protein